MSWRSCWASTASPSVARAEDGGVAGAGAGIPERAGGTRAAVCAAAIYEELADFARERLGLAKLEAWDVAYASEKLRVERYAFSDQEVKQYFPETRVLPGMFAAGREALRHSHRSGEGAELWHPDVRFFDI